MLFRSTLISGIPPWLIMYFEKLIERNGKKIKQLFPNLQLIVTGGVNYEPYREKMEELLGGKVDIIQIFPASEGFFAFQDDFEKEGLLLQSNHGIFYEFIPLEQYGRFDSAQQPLFGVMFFMSSASSIVLSPIVNSGAYSLIRNVAAL